MLGRVSLKVMAAPLQFWFDLGQHVLLRGCAAHEQACARAAVALVWKPFLLGPVFSEQLGISDDLFASVSAAHHV